MSRNGSGTYSLPAGNPVVTGTTISSSWANNTLSDIATALTQSIAYDGQTTPTANLPMGGFKHTGVAVGAALTDYARYDQMQNSAAQWLTGVTGTDTITASAAVTPAAYSAGQTFKFVAAGVNTTTSVTLNVSSLGAKSVTKLGTTALAVGDIPANSVVQVVYDGTQFQITGIANQATLKTYFDTLYLALVAPGTSGNVLTSNGSAWTSASPSSTIYPNFVNSGVMVAQRAGSTINLSTTRQYGQVDNVGIWASGGTVGAGTLTQITSAISGTTGYAARAAGVTLTGSGQISHSIRMEAKDAVKFKNQTCSFSVKVDHDVGSAINYTLVVKKANSADNFSATTTIGTSTPLSVNSATSATVTFNGVSMGDCSNGIELEVQAACGAITTKNFNVTEFAIFVSPTAQSYSPKDYDEEFRRCRWLFVSVGGDALNEIIANAECNTTSQVYGQLTFPPMRIPPTLSVSAAADFAVWYQNTSAAATVFSSNGYASKTTLDFLVSVSGTPLTVGQAALIRTNNTTNARIKLSSEL